MIDGEDASPPVHRHSATSPRARCSDRHHGSAGRRTLAGRRATAPDPAFVGEVQREVANDLAAALARISSPSFELALEGVSHFESKGMPNAIWARVAPAPELERLRAKIDRACDLAGLGCESRRFTPHVTIARLSRHAGPVASWLSRHAGLRATWQADGFSLFESHLLPQAPVTRSLRITRWRAEPRPPGWRRTGRRTARVSLSIGAEAFRRCHGRIQA
jgi:2'-5' RNA ligase